MQTQLCSGEDYQLCRFITWVNNRKVFSFCVKVEKTAIYFERLHADNMLQLLLILWKTPLEFWSIYHLHISHSIFSVELNCTMIHTRARMHRIPILKTQQTFCDIWFCNRQKYCLAEVCGHNCNRIENKNDHGQHFGRASIIFKLNMYIWIYLMLRIWQLFYATLKLEVVGYLK